MNKILMLCILPVILIGCVSAKYNVETKKLSYFRMGDQKLGGVKVSTDKNGSIKVSFESQESQAEALTEAIKTIRELVEAGSAIAK